MRKLAIIALLITFWYGMSSAEWQYVEDFHFGKGLHGVVVDDNGRIWTGHYYGIGEIIRGEDTLSITEIHVQNPDGTHADFSPIQILTNDDDMVDTMDYAGPYSCRGMAKDNDGNILYVSSHMWKIDANTGKVMNHFFPDLGSLTSPSVDENGYIYLGHVGPGKPGYILDEDFELYSYFVEEGPITSRTTLITPDGKDLYYGAIYSGQNGIFHYHSEDGPDGEYTLIDTLGTVFHREEDTTGVTDSVLVVDQNMWAQSLNWGPYNGKTMLYVGTYFDVGENDFTGWWVLDPENNFEAVCNFGTAPATDENGDLIIPPVDDQVISPRFAAWSEDGNTMYTNDFDGGVTKKWTWVETPVNEAAKPKMKTLELAQNYPNPFNPTTTIAYTLKKSGHVSLSVYNLAGQKVANLVNQDQAAGKHKVEFDASKLGSGVYFYRVQSNGETAVKTMMLTK